MCHIECANVVYLANIRRTYAYYAIVRNYQLHYYTILPAYMWISFPYTWTMAISACKQSKSNNSTRPNKKKPAQNENEASTAGPICGVIFARTTLKCTGSGHNRTWPVISYVSFRYYYYYFSFGCRCRHTPYPVRRIHWNPIYTYIYICGEVHGVRQLTTAATTAKIWFIVRF